MITDIKKEKIRKFNLASRIQSLYILSEIKRQYDCVLDLGAGDGEIIKKIKLSEKVNKIYAVENDSIRIERIRKLLLKDMDNVVINQCFAQKLPYDNCFFDLVVCNSVIEHIKDYPLVINEIMRVLKPNGTLIITVPNCNMQFGTINKKFWKFILKLPVIIKSHLCRNEQLAKIDNIDGVRTYLNDYFSHKIRFDLDKVISDFSDGFEVVKVKSYLNFLSGSFHEMAYYFKIFDKRFLLKICFFLVG